MTKIMLKKIPAGFGDEGLEIVNPDIPGVTIVKKEDFVILEIEDGYVGRVVLDISEKGIDYDFEKS